MKNYTFFVLGFVTIISISGCDLSSKKEIDPVEKNIDEKSIKISGYDYDRVRGIMDGDVTSKNFNVSFHVENIYAVNRKAFSDEQEYDVTEIGLIPFITKYINDDFRDYALIPVFISRTFRHRNIFVHTDSGIDKPEDLVGKKVGTPGYGMSANTWIRGFLLDQHGVKANDFQWIQTTKSSDGFELNSDLSNYYFEDDFPLIIGPKNVDESELLLSGQCDALITAITPKSFLEGNPKIKRLYPDIKAAEISYFQETGMFPIMHAVAVKKDLLRENPLLGQEIFRMYCDAKRIAYDNLETTTSLKVTLPWITNEFERTQEIMGDNYWKYGIEANRKELEAIMRYVYEQGLVKRQISFEELFDPNTLRLIDEK